MKVLFMGTGTSVGVPMIGCRCDVCLSENPKDRRTRTGLYVEAGGQCFVIDTSPDFREQVLAYNILHIDAVFFTHSHADHIFGFDDIRRYNTIQNHQCINAYAAPETLVDLERIFDYVMPQKVSGVYRPLIEFKPIDSPMQIGSAMIEPIVVEHGNKYTQGYIISEDGKEFAYVPDCASMPQETFDRVKNVDVMVLDGLRHTPHPTHLTIENSVELLQKINAKTSYVTHICHELSNDYLEKNLPDNIFPSYDGLQIEL
ncbi:MAG: MBL fold metallo-hydrolase [Kiritimatiellae bacterium]|nr:MBL fold metallo-hydrolase [Kiritimatiellia bacterium]